MPLSHALLNRIKPLITAFRNELKIEFAECDLKIQPQNLLETIKLVRAHQEIFLHRLTILINELKNIIFTDIHNKHLEHQSFSAIRLDIQQLINPLIVEFNANSRNILQKSVPSGEPQDLVISDFERKLDKEISDLFVEYEDQFDDIK